MSSIQALVFLLFASCGPVYSGNAPNGRGTKREVVFLHCLYLMQIKHLYYCPMGRSPYLQMQLAFGERVARILMVLLNVAELFCPGQIQILPLDVLMLLLLRQPGNACIKMEWAGAKGSISCHVSSLYGCCTVSSKRAKCSPRKIAVIYF